MILEFAAGNETGGWAMNYNATGDLIKITHLTTGTVETRSMGSDSIEKTQRLQKINRV
jgi:hypothetical protein